MNWFKRLLENEEDKNKRIFEKFSTRDEFKNLLREEAKNIILENIEEKERLAEQSKKEHYEKLEKAKVDIEFISESMQNSDEPFVSVISLGFDKEQGLKVKLDFNNAFIRYLNKSGIKAANNEETVRVWLAHLNYDIGQEMLAEDYLLNGINDEDIANAPKMDFDEMFGINEDDGNLGDSIGGNDLDEDESDYRW